MTVFQPGRQEVGTGFEQPFDMLVACHERLERTLALLNRLVAYLDTEGCDLHAREAARDVMRYFDIAAPAHHEDEERHVFPMLDAMDDQNMRDLAQRLRHDHQVMAVQWAALKPLLIQVMAGHEGPYDDLAKTARHFHELHVAHLMLENECVFMPAHTALAARGGDALQRMGDEMARRRGLRRRRTDGPDFKESGPPESR